MNTTPLLLLHTIDNRSGVTIDDVIVSTVNVIPYDTVLMVFMVTAFNMEISFNTKHHMINYS